MTPSSSILFIQKECCNHKKLSTRNIYIWSTYHVRSNWITLDWNSISVYLNICFYLFHCLKEKINFSTVWIFSILVLSKTAGDLLLSPFQSITFFWYLSMASVTNNSLNQLKRFPRYQLLTRLWVYIGLITALLSAHLGELLGPIPEIVKLASRQMITSSPSLSMVWVIASFYRVEASQLLLSVFTSRYKQTCWLSWSLNWKVNCHWLSNIKTGLKFALCIWHIPYWSGAVPWNHSVIETLKCKLNTGCQAWRQGILYIHNLFYSIRNAWKCCPPNWFAFN